MYVEKRLSEGQNGFRAGRSCMDVLFTIKRLKEMSEEMQQELWMIFVDFTKAYDTIVRERMWMVMREMGAPEHFIAKVAALHEATHVKVRIGSLLGEEFRTKLGLRQGCVLAPVLFNLYLDSIMRRVQQDLHGVSVKVNEDGMPKREIRVAESRFADDMTLCEGREEEIVRSFAAVREKAQEDNLMVSEKKTKVMIVGGDGSVKRKSLKTGGLELEVVESFILVGSEISGEHERGALSEVKRRRALAAATFKSLLTILWKRREVSVEIKMRIFNACVLSRLLYGAETWVVYAGDLASLEAFQNNCLRRILRLSWMERVTGVEVRRRCCGQPTIEEILRQRRMRWLGHVQRMGPERQPKAMYWGMRDGKRKQGGQRKSWMQQARQDLEELRVTHDWRSKCQDRGAWVKLIKPTAGKKTKAEGRYQARKAQTEQPEGLGKVSASKRKTQKEQPEGLEKVSACKRDVEEMITTTIEQITKRRRMTAVEREALQISCDRCGKQFSRPQDLKRHNNLMPNCGTVKRRMTVAERAKLPFKCETCGERFSRQQDIARHKCSSSSRMTSSAVSQTK